MKHRLFTILCSISLLLCLAVSLLWVRSYYVRDIVGFGIAGGNSHLAQSILGRFHFLSFLDGRSAGGFSYSSDRLSRQAIWNGGMSHYPVTPHWRLGFIFQAYTRYTMDFSSPSGGWTNHLRLIVMPYWFPTAVFALPPALWLLGWRRRRIRSTAGLCQRCGYDLRASKDRCPECGTPITSRVE